MASSPDTVADAVAAGVARCAGVSEVDGRGRQVTGGPRGTVAGVGVRLRAGGLGAAWISVEVVARGDVPVADLARAVRRRVREIASAHGLDAERIDVDVTDVEPRGHPERVTRPSEPQSPHAAEQAEHLADDAAAGGEPEPDSRERETRQVRVVAVAPTTVVVTVQVETGHES